jgi:outer membrane protein assembly factor BamB/tRNA A-37 threonylcarbamoyl transferase component Bud32
MALLKKGVGGRSTSLLRKKDEDETRSVEPQETSTIQETETPRSHEKPETATVTDQNEASGQQPGTQTIKAETGDLQALADGSVLQNRYVIDGILGIGGMSVVYRGRDSRFKDVVRYCAIKEMYQTAPDSQTRMLKLRHFEREAGLLATLNHPSIPKVYDFFEENSRVYLVQELVPGQDMESILEETNGPMDEKRVISWAIQICDVLSYLHNHKPEPIVFRDMKPSNVLVTPDERIVLIDFGIARLLDPTQRKGTMIGTEGYAPPEQYRGTADPQGDIYALGATLHHLLTNSDPRLETPFTFNERPIHRFNPSVSEEVEQAVSKALAYSMDERWSTTEEFKQALIQATGLSGSFHSGSMGMAQPAAPVATGTKLVWKFTCEDEIRSSPFIHNGVLYIGCYDHNLYAIDIQGGSFVWKFATEAGINSSPTVWQDLVIVGSEDGYVYGVDTRNGKSRWRFRTDKAIRSSPRVQERVVFIGSDDNNFYALDGLRGVIIWNYRAWMPFRSSAALGDNVIYTGCDDSHVYCLEIRNATLKWKQRTQKPVVSTPCYNEGMVYVGSTDNHLYALNSQAGTPIWKYRTDHQVYSSPTVVGNNVVVGSADGHVYSLDKKQGRLIWSYEAGGQVISSPYHHNGRIYIGSVNGIIHCISADNGKMLWKYETDGPVVSSALVVDETVFIASMDHKVYALKA